MKTKLIFTICSLTLLSSAQAHYHSKDNGDIETQRPVLRRAEAVHNLPKLQDLFKLQNLYTDSTGRVRPLLKHSAIPAKYTKLRLVPKVSAMAEELMISAPAVLSEAPMVQTTLIMLNIDSTTPAFKSVSARIREYEALIKGQETSQTSEGLSLEAPALKVESASQESLPLNEKDSAGEDALKSLCLTPEEKEKQLDFAEAVLKAFHKREFTGFAHQFSDPEAKKDKIVGITLDPLLNIVLSEVVGDLKKAHGYGRRGHAAIPSRFMGSRSVRSVS